MNTKSLAVVMALTLSVCVTAFGAGTSATSSRDSSPEAKSDKAAASARYKRIRAKAHRNAARARAHARALRAGEPTTDLPPVTAKGSRH